MSKYISGENRPVQKNDGMLFMLHHFEYTDVANFNYV